jgi:predicted deacylase
MAIGRLIATVGSALLASGPVVSSADSPAAESFALGPIEARPGTSVSGFLDVDAGGAGEWPPADIPVTVVHGAGPGPVLALIAGTHGYEYAPILALQSLRRELDPGSLNGTLVLVHIANMPSFFGRTVYTGPVDGRNLNRVYPGASGGSLSERIAHVITTEVIDQADYLVDLHAGDGNENLVPYIYMPVTGDAKLDAASRGLALAFGLEHIVIDDVQLPPPEASRFTDHTALVRGVPAITTETGELGSGDERWTALAQAGVLNVMRHLGMLAGAAETPGVVTWLTGYEVLTSPDDGMWFAQVRAGEQVREGQLLGRWTDLFGDASHPVTAPFSGFVNYVVATPPVRAGDPVAMISRFAGSE